MTKGHSCLFLSRISKWPWKSGRNALKSEFREALECCRMGPALPKAGQTVAPDQTVAKKKARFEHMAHQNQAEQTLNKESEELK